MHTQEPWKTYEEDKKSGPCWSAFDETNSFAVAEQHGHIIARVCKSSMRGSDAKDNLRVILASPKMLEALQVNLKATAGYVGPGHVEAYNLTREAIEEATGKDCRPEDPDECVTFREKHMAAMQFVVDFKRMVDNGAIKLVILTGGFAKLCADAVELTKEV